MFSEREPEPQLACRERKDLVVRSWRIWRTWKNWRKDLEDLDKRLGTW